MEGQEREVTAIGLDRSPASRNNIPVASTHGGTEMYLHLLLVCVLPSVAGAAVQPARPDLKALIRLPTPLEKLPAERRAEMEARLAETTALCRVPEPHWESACLRKQ